MLLALDQGTTSSRALIFDLQGNIVASSQKEFKQYFPKSGYVEHDADEIWSSQYSVAIEALAKAHARTGDAIALAAYCGNSNKLDKSITSFAAAYADQVTSDYKLFMKAIKAGKIKTRQPA